MSGSVRFDVRRIGDIAVIGSGTTPARAKASRYFSEAGHAWVKTGDLNNSVILTTNEKITDAAVYEANCTLYPAGTLLVAMYGGYKQIGRTGLLASPAAVNQAISAVQLDIAIAVPAFVQQYLNHAVEDWKRFAASSRKDPNITRSDVQGFRVPLPPLSEQRKIVEILRSWDDAIEKAERHRHHKGERNRSLITRLIAAGHDAHSTPLARFVRPITAKNTISETRVLTSSAARGLVDQRAYFKKGIASVDLSGYYLLERGDFAYNRSSSINSPFGAIRRLNEYSHGVISTLYICFRHTNDELADADFLDHLLRSGYLDRQLALITHEGARNHGLLNIAKDDFFELTAPLPPIRVQRQIASALDERARELALLDREIELLRTQKRGLMQKLLTGEIRVNSNEEAGND
ncbi:restriction endonuclease subunit S [Agromyces sp. ISL-38]|uniref:restriction endonuclease subunit S n=1 Tax=Agromyces sp. ISL-38 TaxID=2819107 RepID=UPI001BED1538|nr:restriction endonuclease subunit S [Agromyces sp. ISL-38]MBT2497570.1 restriction endonuclease subunit S [Agromyces sp. ISL-38]